MDPRSYITLAGASNILNVNVKKEPVYEGAVDMSVANYEAFDDEWNIFSLDTQTLEMLTNTNTDNSHIEPTASQGPESQSICNNAFNSLITDKADVDDIKKPSKKKKKSDEL